MLSATDPILLIKNKISEEEYGKGCRIYDLRKGRSAGREWKASVFFALAMLMLFILMRSGFDIIQNPLSPVILGACVFMCIFYIIILPFAAEKKGRDTFRKSSLLCKEYEIRIYRDRLEMKNKNEYLKRYYTEITDCIETNEIFVLIGGIEKNLLVISKNGLQEDEKDQLSRIFRKEMIRQYRKTKKGEKK